MKYLLLLAWRTVRANRTRSLLTVAIIALSVAMVVVVSGLCATCLDIQRQTVLFHLSPLLSVAEKEHALASDWGMNMFRAVSIFMNGLIMTIASCSIYASLSAGIRERAKCTAALMTMGATSLQKAFFTLSETLILAFTGIPLGILIGLPINMITSLQLSNILQSKGYGNITVVRFDHFTVLKMAGLGLLTVLLATAITLYKTRSRSIISLLKTTAGIEVSLKPSLLDWIMWRLFGKAGELASAGYVNQKKNYRFLSFSFAVAIAFYACGSLIVPYYAQLGEVAPSDQAAYEQTNRIINFAIQSVTALAVTVSLCMFSTNFLARKGEFAIYLSIGMETSMLYRIVILEWVWRGFYLFLYGFFGSQLLNFAIYCLLASGGVATELLFPGKQLIHAFLAVILLSAVMTVATIQKIRRMNIVEILKATY